MDSEQQRKLNQSQGIRLSRPDVVFKPKNRIEAALAQNKQVQSQAGDLYLPQIKKSAPAAEPLKIIQEDVPKQAIPKKPSKFPKIFSFIRPLLLLIFVFALVALVAYGAYEGVTKFSKNHTTDPKSIIAAVSKLTTLPQGETPTVVTVANLDPLKDQPIFKNAKVGDTLLIFTKAKKAILYRQSENKIIVSATLTD